MVSNMTGSFQLMKSLNRSLVLNIIRTEGAISRTETAKKAGLTPPTVSTIVSELLEEGLIREGQTGVSSGGRKPILLSINHNSRYVIGVDVGTEEVRAALTNLNADVLAVKKKQLVPGMNEEEFLSIVIGLVQSMLEEKAADGAHVIGIGVGMHGIVDHTKGESIYAPHFGFQNMPIKVPLEEAFQLPVHVENDVRSMALAELWFGGGRNSEDLLVINVGHGIGAGCIVNGRIYRGRHHIAGEIGHMIVDLNGRQCTCGGYGCLHTVASGIRIRERVIQEITLGRKTAVLDEVDGEKERIDGETVHRAAMKGDYYAQEVLAEVGRFLGVGITNLIHALNPDKIIIGGGVSKAGDYIFKPLQKVVGTRAVTDAAKKTEIELSKLGDTAAIRGAATLVLSELYDYQKQER
ncbi:ROK family transcriptional regulator [Alkalicoccus urumqiensis]|uniref:Sugar kinase n=1 Tax=Alkalicoccus urumqiensis TaxID=1548213 RepID=A0A2P6ML53_ALKUR|nr:ROK family transcriptional regulator [Alkalicoccus urumqiensis]PRO67010.1 sugar kinase [Alkalicoccus urumqiensis]